MRGRIEEGAMLRFTLSIMAAVLGFLAAAALAAEGAGWDRIWTRLSAWDGGRVVTVQTDLPDPYASAVYRELVNGLLDRGFTVIQGVPDAAPPRGLLAEVRDTAAGPVVAVTARRDQALLVLEPLGAPARQMTAPAADEGAGSGQRLGARQVPAPTPLPAPRGTAPQQRLDLQSRPHRLAAFTRPGGGTDFLLLHDDRLELARLEGGRLVVRDSVPAGAASTRALYVGAANLDDDPAQEVVVVWGQDRDIVKRGTYTKLLSRVYEADGGLLQAKSGNLERYLRTVGGVAFAQGRSVHAPFQGNVARLVRLGGGHRPRDADWSWGRRWLYDATPLADGRAVAWVDARHLDIVTEAGTAGRLREASTDLGEITHPKVFSRLKEPQSLTGPESGYGLKWTAEVALPRRVVLGRDGAVYTIDRDRSAGVLGLLGGRGQDRVVRLLPAAHGLRREEPFPGVDAFVLDFALIEQGGTTSVALLANGRPDGSGAAALVLQGFPGS